jgi:hypothetical protein
MPSLRVWRRPESKPAPARQLPGPIECLGRPEFHVTPVDRLIRQFDLEQLDRDLFLGDAGPRLGRLFGGLVATQAVTAAGRMAAVRQRKPGRPRCKGAHPR